MKRAANTCQENIAAGSRCTRPAKLIAVDGTGNEKWVCGVHAKTLESSGRWSLRPLERFDPAGTGRGVSGWLMVPMTVTVDTKGTGRIVEVHPYWEMARVARDDFDGEIGFEVAEPMPSNPMFWQGKDGANGEIERPSPGEIKRWKDIVFEDIQQFLEEESEPVGAYEATWVPSAVVYGQP